jgi:hypothetical protein
MFCWHVSALTGEKIKGNYTGFHHIEKNQGSIAPFVAGVSEK